MKWSAGQLINQLNRYKKAGSWLSVRDVSWCMHYNICTVLIWTRTLWKPSSFFFFLLTVTESEWHQSLGNGVRVKENTENCSLWNNLPVEETTGTNSLVHTHRLFWKGHIMSSEEEREAGKSGFRRRVNSSLSVRRKWREIINDWRSFTFSTRGSSWLSSRIIC